MYTAICCRLNYLTSVTERKIHDVVYTYKTELSNSLKY